jgi:hypothetical protein
MALQQFTASQLKAAFATTHHHAIMQKATDRRKAGAKRKLSALQADAAQAITGLEQRLAKMSKASAAPHMLRMLKDMLDTDM